MLRETGFNSVAGTYDADFTHSITGRMQRRRVWQYLEKHIREPQQILEINCGTGEDAVMLAKQGHHVTATDVAREMIAVALQKKKPGNVILEVCGFDELLLKYNTRQFDMVFSNFAGLNCVNTAALKKLNNDFCELLKPGGKLIIVLLGKKCWVERVFFTLKGEHEKARRRLQEATARLSHMATQQTFCYDAKEVVQLFPDFTLTEKKPVGLFIPPSYLEPLVKRNRFLLPLIRFAEWMAGGLNTFSDYADHTFIVLEKK